MLAGAYVAGQLYDESSAALQLQATALIFWPLVRKWLAQRRERELMYDSLDPFDPALLTLDERNFQIVRTDVARTWFRRNRSRWAAFNVGVVELELLGGTRRRLILAGNQPDPAMEEPR
jgi:hypothetical protein